MKRSGCDLTEVSTNLKLNANIRAAELVREIFNNLDQRVISLRARTKVLLIQCQIKKSDIIGQIGMSERTFYRKQQKNQFSVEEMASIVVAIRQLMNARSSKDTAFDASEKTFELRQSSNKKLRKQKH